MRARMNGRATDHRMYRGVIDVGDPLTCPIATS